jgi:hypothetical protein
VCEFEHRIVVPSPKCKIRAIFQKIEALWESGANQDPVYIIRVGTVRYSPYSKEPSTRIRIHSGFGSSECECVKRSVFV